MQLATTQEARIRLWFASLILASSFLLPLSPAVRAQSGSTQVQGPWITSLAQSEVNDSIYATEATSLLLRQGNVHHFPGGDLANGEAIGETASSAWKIVVLRNGTGLIVSDYAGNLMRKSLEAASEPKQLATGLRWIRAMVEIPNNRLVVGTEDGKLIVFDLEKDSETARLDGHASQVMQLAMFGDALISCSADGVVKFWAADDLTMIREHKLTSNAIWSAILSPDHRYLLSGGADRRLQLHNAETGRLIMTLGVLPDWVTAIQLLPSDVVAAGCMNGRVYLFHLPSKLRIKELPGPGSAIWCLGASGDGRKLVAGTRKHGIFEVMEHAWEKELQAALERFATEHPPMP